MKKYLWLLICVGIWLTAATSCITSEEYPRTQRGNFEALWKIIDTHYCFFDFKQKEYGLNWNEVRERYARQVSDTMTKRAFFQVMGNMCRELRDGHVNLWTPFNTARYTQWYELHPMNYSDSLERKTLGTVDEYQMTGGMKYKVLSDNIGYLRCESFNVGIGDGNVHEVMRYLALCDGLIIDVRNNSGGMLTSATTLASAFTNQTVTVGYIVHKTGPGHRDFSHPRPITLHPLGGMRWQKPVAILTNRKTFSAANAFVMYMKALPNVTTIGDKTGGGSGMPFSSELPNGWSIRFSASPIYNARMEHTEFGISPDIAINISSTDYVNGYDTILARARRWLKTHQ